MKDKEIIAFHEAYTSIYSQPEQLTEEVEIAAQYFFEMGLNEDGVSILIEELGVGEFAEWVYDIAEEYLLTEARSGGEKIEPETAKGGKIKGKPKAASLKRLQKLKAERKEREEKSSSEKPSGLKASLQRQSAVANAKKAQPKKRGFLDRVAHEVNKGVQRHKAAMSAARETGKTIKKAAGKIGGVAREVGKGASGTTRLAAHVASRGLGEEVDPFDVILEYLVTGGYADTNEAALAIMANMSEEWKHSINENRVKDLGDRLKDLQQRSATTDVKAKKTAGLARRRFNDLSDKEEKFRKGVEDFARATKKG